MTSFEDRLGYHFKTSALLMQALTHISAGTGQDYERLEFLGDRVLGLVIADLVFEKFPDEAEGDLALRHAALVRAKMLAVIARDLSLLTDLKIAQAENADPGDNVLSDALEAVIGAMYRDGGYAACQPVIARLWAPHIDQMHEPPQDPKTALQEWAQARKHPVPEYKILEKSGPDHAPHFRMRVRIVGLKGGEAFGEGSSRKTAEKAAATALLRTLIGADHP